MKLTVTSVHDSKQGDFGAPYFSRTRAVALRLFKDEVNRAGSPFNKNPEDYTLFDLGIYEDETAEFTLLPTPSSIQTAISLKDNS